MADYLIKNAEVLKMLLLLQILSYSHQIWTQGPPTILHIAVSTDLISELIKYSKWRISCKNDPYF